VAGAFSHLAFSPLDFFTDQTAPTGGGGYKHHHHKKRLIVDDTDYSPEHREPRVAIEAKSDRPRVVRVKRRDAEPQPSRSVPAPVASRRSAETFASVAELGRIITAQAIAFDDMQQISLLAARDRERADEEAMLRLITEMT
jgi:hypothetical protein